MTLGYLAYDTYKQALAAQFIEIPQWYELNESDQQAWESVGGAVRDRCVAEISKLAEHPTRTGTLRDYPNLDTPA